MTALDYRSAMFGRARARVVVVLIAVLLGACTAAPGSPSATVPAGPSDPVDPSASTQTSDAPTGSPEASASPSPTSAADPFAGFASIAPAEGVLNAIVVGDGTVVVGGFLGPRFAPSIHVLADGTWMSASIPDGSGQVTGIAAFGDRLLAVGNALPDARTGFVWESSDGRAWRLVETLEAASLHDIAVSDGIAVAVGARLDAEMNATATAWRSTDGTSWQRASVSGAGTASMRSTAATATGFAATGHRRLGEPRPFWTTTDGQRWAAVDNDLGDQLLPTDLVARVDELVMVGASGRSGEQHPFVATSSDGARWRRTNLSGAEGYASAAAVVEDRLVVAGVDADRHTHWSEADGGWQATTYEASGAAVSALWWDPAAGLLGVGSRDRLQATWAFEGT
jgi:hypothetical protein